MSGDVIRLVRVLIRRVDVNDAGCWIWSGCVAANGYGRVSIAGKKSRLAYRYVYEVFVGPVPPGLVVTAAERDAREQRRLSHAKRYEAEIRTTDERWAADVAEVRSLVRGRCVRHAGTPASERGFGG